MTGVDGIQNVRVTATGSTSVTFSWDNAMGCIPEYVILPSGTDMHTAQPTLITSNASHYSVTSLTPATAYRLYVRNHCADGTPSAWTTIDFRTMQIPASLPYQHTFNSEEENLAWTLLGANTNFFAIGTEQAFCNEKSLYISHDELPGTYNATKASYAYAFRTLSFDDGSYQVAYACKGKGLTSDV